jgi:hypothetical protein
MTTVKMFCSISLADRGTQAPICVQSQPFCQSLQDTSWLDIYIPEIHHFIYWVDDASATDGAVHRTSLNKGNEAMAYLQFILDFYDALPASIVFMHGTRCDCRQPDHRAMQVHAHSSVFSWEPSQGTSYMFFLDNHTVI